METDDDDDDNNNNNNNNAEMKYMRRTAGYTWTDHKTNTQIAKELKITPFTKGYETIFPNWQKKSW